MKIKIAIAAVMAAASVFAGLVVSELRELPPSLAQVETDAAMTQFLDRNGEPLNYSYRSFWNVHDKLPLHAVPEQLQKMFIASEDKRFYVHGGTDWRARASALFQNIRARKVVRGASTLTEQVVRMIYPRPRTYFPNLSKAWRRCVLNAAIPKRTFWNFI